MATTSSTLLKDRNMTSQSNNPMRAIVRNPLPFKKASKVNDLGTATPKKTPLKSALTRAKPSKKASAKAPKGLTPSRLRDTSGTDYLSISAPKTGGGRAVITVPMAMRMNVSGIIAELYNAGALLPAQKEKAKELVEACLLSTPESAGLLAQRTGWHERIFVEGTFNLNTQGRTVVPAKDLAAAAKRGHGKAGDLDTWKQSVALAGLRSDYLAFGLQVGLSAALARFGGLGEGAIFNICGTSSTGKSTVLRAAKSLLGSTAILTTWDATQRGLHEVAAASSDLPLVLDDLETFRASNGRRSHELSRALQTLTSHTSGAIAAMARDRLPLLDWSCWALSSSPFPLTTYFRAEGKEPTAGDRIRWIDIPVPGPASGGIWSEASSARQPAARSEAVTSACRENFGVAIKPWVRFLINRDTLDADILSYRDEFVSAAAPNASDTDRRAALKFGVVYAGGRLAIEADLLPWPEGRPMAVCTRLFRLYLSASLHETAALRTAASNLLAALSDDVRIPTITAGTPSFDQESAYDGFRRGTTVYLKAEAIDAKCGAHSQRLLEEVGQAEARLPGEGKKSTVQKRVTVNGVEIKKRMFPFYSRKLQAALHRLMSMT
ncbi:MAG: DUF927 domain-containing protein [Rhizobiaceae bacterium]